MRRSGSPTPGGYRPEPLHFYGMAAGDAVIGGGRCCSTWRATWVSTGSNRDSRSGPIGIGAIPWLHDHDVAMIAVDNAACQVVPAESGAPFLTWHVAALRDLGLLVGELFDLDELAADCAADGVFEGFFVAAPMPVVGASGSPLNPIVVK